MLQIEEKMVHLSDCESSENVLKPKESPDTGCMDVNSVTDRKETARPGSQAPCDGLKDESEYNSNCNLLKNTVSCKCVCHFSTKSCSYDNNMMECAKFREILLIHLDLIEQQNINLQRKEKRIQQLKTENDQLTARINRMERRVALKVRKNTTKDDTDIDVDKAKTNEYKRRSSVQKLKRSSHHTSAVAVTSKQGKETGTGMYLKTDFSYLHSTNYSSFEKYNGSKMSKIQVPVWKNVSAQSMDHSENHQSSNYSLTNSDEERTDDESYLRRHLKMEIDEIRRKRWDIQQLRQERMQESLKQRQKHREDTKNTRSISNPIERQMDSLHPSLRNVMALEIAEDVPVFALGARIPQLEQSEFELPWFDVAKREILNRQRNVKISKKQRRKTWYKY